MRLSKKKKKVSAKLSVELNLSFWDYHFEKFSWDGARLSPRQIRFWELILGLPHPTANARLKPGRQGIWEKRVSPSHSIPRF
jgi:hypothetical protein